MKIGEIISSASIELAMQASSKKRVLENLSELLSKNTDMETSSIFQTITERERIGSTGIGEGIAIPHSRIKGLQKPVGAFAILEKQIDFDSIDQKPVNLVFALIVPEEASEEHLQLLAQLAKIFSDSKTKEKLLEANSPDSALLLFQEFNPNQAVA